MSLPQHPVIGVGAVVFHDDKILLVKRNQAPNKGQWAIPGGKVHLGESLRAAAEREILEETGIHIKAGKPVHSFELIDTNDQDEILFHYVIIDLTAEYISGVPKPGDDVCEANWVNRSMLATLPVNQETRELLRQRFNFYHDMESEPL